MDLRIFMKESLQFYLHDKEYCKKSDWNGY